jgi:hypothetical protein
MPRADCADDADAADAGAVDGRGALSGLLKAQWEAH